MGTKQKPVVLVVLDGFGMAPESKGNAISLANKPHFDFFQKNFPFTTLQASGVAIGLPWGEAGNSEVGHLTIGAGRILYHHLPRIIFSIQDGSFFRNVALLKAVNHVKQNNSSLHIIGLTSSGSVHSYIDHLYAILELVKRETVPNAFLHVVTDGKDAPQSEAGKFIPELEKRIQKEYPMISIASLIGRFYAMDRDEKWDRVQKAYDLLIEGKGRQFSDIAGYLSESYKSGITDQFIEPAYRLDDAGAPLGRIRDGDALIIFDFREDSVREISEALVKPGFDLFPKKNLQNFLLVTMTEYEKNLPAIPAFPPLEVRWPVARVISESGKTQLHIAETEKYAHVTYFFNGGQEKPFAGESRILVQSGAVPHFDDDPGMGAEDIKNRILENLDKYDVFVVNFANADMVGHTGNLEATISSVEHLDRVVGEIVDAVLNVGGVCIITADHGNAEQKIDFVSGRPSTEHTTNPVPFYLISNAFKLRTEKSSEAVHKENQKVSGILADVAPTVLEIMNLPKPDEMTGKSLLPELLK